MQPEWFTADAPGELERLGAGRWAYVPAPLPPQRLGIDGELLALSSRADQGIGRLAGLGLSVPNAHLLIRPFMRQEAVSSSRIEGTTSDHRDLARAQLRPDLGGDDVEEVSNYVAALDLGLDLAAELPLSKRLIRRVHERLMAGVRGRHRSPGQFRRVQVWIGSGSSIEQAIYVPPPPPRMESALDDLERFLHAESHWPILIKAALVHYQFEAIHPFEDGNGRVGRLLITLMLCVEKVLPQPLLYLSDYFERHRPEYYRYLLEVSTAGRWEQWVAFFLTGVVEQADAAYRAAERLLALRDQYHDQAHDARVPAALHKAIDHLFVSPMVDARQVGQVLGVSGPTAQSYLKRLVNLGLIEEETGRERDRIYAARAILDAVDHHES